MPIIKSIPTQKRINGFIVNVSETAIVTEKEYSTTGESCIILKGVQDSNLEIPMVSFVMKFIKSV